MVVCLGLLALGLVGLLLLDVSLEKGTYLLRDQNTRTEQLREQEQRLQQEIQAREAPQDLAARARRLGMVDAAGGPVFVLPNGRTIGVPQRAVAPPSPTVTASRSVSPGASGAPKPTVPAATGSGKTPGSATGKATGKATTTGAAQATTTGAARATTTAPAPKPTPRR